MRVFGLTKLGRRVISDKWEDTEEFRVLDYLGRNKTATEGELEVIGGEKFVLRRLKERGLIRELTT